MFALRPFRNSDPPALIDVWSAQSPERGLVSRMDVGRLEHFVLAKPWFDRQGLIVAESDGRVIGFVHAGFGPNSNGSEIDYGEGVICMLQVIPDFDSEDLRRELISAAEQYLAQKGAKRVYGGSFPPMIPFYHGLTDSSELPGVFESDQPLRATYEASGYTLNEEFVMLGCQLARVRPVVDRTQRSLQRTHAVRATLDHTFDTWWDTCSFGPLQRSQFEVVAKKDNRVCGSMIWWDPDWTNACSGSFAVSLSRVNVIDESRRAGLATFLVSSALKQLRGSGTASARVQVATLNAPGLEFFRKLGFVETGRGATYSRQL